MGVLIVNILAAVLVACGVISRNIFFVISVSSIIWMFIGMLLYFKLGLFKFFYHDFLHWHAPDDSPYYCDGLTEHATCKYCGKDIMQDSQGNWF